MSSLKEQLLSGVLFTAIAKYSGVFISLFVAGVLGRLISPDDFGVMAIATVIIIFFNLFTDIGISPAIVQHKDLTERNLSDIFSFTVWMGLGLGALFFAASWPIAAWYKSDVLRTLCQVLSINLFFSAVTIVPGAMFYRNKEFKFIAIRSFIIQVSTGALSIGAALMGAGLYTLLITPILSSMLMFTISARRYPQRMRLTTGWSSLKIIFSYSAYQFLFNVINYFSMNFDKLIIPKIMNMTELGYYEKSYRLMSLPLQNITVVITPVMHPIFSDFRNDLKKLASSYEPIVRLLAFIGIPLSVFLFFSSEELMLLIFGNQWVPSIPVLRVLTLSVAQQIILYSSGSIYQAAGDTRSLFICGLFSSILNVTGMCVGIFYFDTLTALAACISVTITINFVQCYWWMYHVTLKRSLAPFIRQLGSPLLLGLITACILAPVHFLLKGNNLMLTIIVKGIVYFSIFVLYIQLTKEFDILGKAKSLINRKKNV